MNTADVKVTEGSGKNVATYSITEDAETKQIQRVALCDSSGNERTTLPVSGTFWQATQPVSVSSLPLPTGAATEATISTLLTQSDFDSKIGSLTESAPATDTASSGINGRLQRIAQRLTSLIALIPAALTGAGNFKVSLAEASASVAVTGTFWQSTQPVSIAGSVAVTGTFWQSTQPISVTAQTTGGATAYKLISANSTNATSVKASAGTLYGIQVYNLNASPRYLKLYNKASAPTVGTDTPVKVIMIPGNASGAGSNITVPICGIEFSSGIAFALTTGITDADNTAVAASEIVVNLEYK